MTTQSPATTDDPLGTVVGQDEAVARLRAAVRTPVHAYLFVGPRGTGKKAAALAFGAALLTRDSTDPAEAERITRLALGGRHPDVRVFTPEGRTMRVTEAEQLVTEASRSPVECARKVLVVERFHTAEPEAAASLLKTIEEPPPTVTFVLLAEDVPAEHVTIASRCTRLDFAPITQDVLVADLTGRGIDAERARRIAANAGGSLDRARLLATDPEALRRSEAWASVPDRLDGTGAAVAVLVEELRDLIDKAQAPLTARQAEEEDRLAEQEKAGMAAGARKALAERHRREQRLLRDDELRSGLAVLARRYRDRLAADPSSRRWDRAVQRIAEAAEALTRNPNEALLLQALFLDLPPLGERT